MNKGWAEDLYFKSKNRTPCDVIWPDCPWPRFRYAINGIIHQIGFQREVELKASMQGVKLK